MVDPSQLTPKQQKQLEEKLKKMSPEELQEFQKQQCIFCQIVAGKIPSKKIYEDETCLAILDINPATKGHILLLPKEHYAIMPQMPEEVIGKMFTVAKTLSQVVLKALKVPGTNLFVANGLAAGQKAQHFMIHIIPRKEDDGLFAVEEKLINQELREKVKGAMESKLNELLGVKKEVQKKLPAEEKPEEEAPAEEESEEKDEEREEEPEEEGDDKGEEEQDDEKTDLDDIANLFK